jgi:hypothetical protein
LGPLPAICTWLDDIWLENTSSALWVSESYYTYPVLLSLHAVGLTIAVELWCSPLLTKFKSRNQVMLPALYDSNCQFIQTPSQVKILVEMNHAVRTIALKAAPLPKQIRLVRKILSVIGWAVAW